ncbi:phage tail sheath C-terminal domain-containing protein [Kutzneria sp. NPDC052558]|uniref:phage tail sheath C-terminal domain-containing protein n=1 Tax=Kutzneria sp. NPDC052558 TaxID=3364121 RepID=UPI0037C65ACB
MTEMIIPSTYVDVRAEGLISAGGVATGVLGVVGTASGGPVGQVVTLSGLAAARDLFGVPDDFDAPTGAAPLTLVRALEQAYANGASSVLAVRVAGAGSAAATFVLGDKAGAPVATLSARAAGTDGNNIHVTVTPSTVAGSVAGEELTAPVTALRHPRVLPSPANRIRVVRGTSRRVDSFAITYRTVVENERVAAAGTRYFLSRTPVATPTDSATVASVTTVTVTSPTGAVKTYGNGDFVYGPGDAPAAGVIRVLADAGELVFAPTEQPTGSTVVASYGVFAPAPTAGQVRITVWDGTLDFAAADAPKAADGDKVQAWYQVAAASCVAVRLDRGSIVENYVAPDGATLAAAVTAGSTLATATADATHGSELPAAGVDGYFGTGANKTGANGESATADDYAAGLELLANQTVNIVVPAGQDATSFGAQLQAHLAETEQADHERIGVLGAPGSTVPEFLGHSIASDRIVLVAPGIALAGGTHLPPAYTAAAVAGLLGSAPAQTSLTNKALTVPGLAVAANRGEQAQLITRGVLSIVDKQGFRVVKGVTTEGPGEPFSAIPTRRIVDFAKYGVRAAANPYIGRLNNDRVRSALKSTVDAFLTGMVSDEALTSYSLSVSATRAQEIAGEVAVTMTIQPTFSIDYIRVTMVLS